MPNTEIVRALVNAFNVNNYDFNAVKTNFKLKSRGGEDCIVVSFDKGMKDYQCSEYLDSIKRKIIREFYGIEESNDKEILDTAKKDFDVTSFPFNYIYKGDWSVDKQGRIEFVAPVDQGVIFNLKSHLAASLAKDVLEDIRVSSTAVPFNKKKYLWCGEFDNKELRKKFEHEFLSRMRERYENVPKNPLKIEGNSVYIKDVFDDAHFVDSIARRVAWRIGIDLGIGNDVDHSVMLLKDSIINSVYQLTKIIVGGFICASPLSREEASVLIPLILDSGRRRVLTKEEALELNYALNGAVLNDIDGKAQGELSVNGNREKYGIDFSNKEISYCVITKIVESSVINKDHELAIDPERALSPAQSPFNSPTHAEPSGLRTPPKQIKGKRDSGLGDSPPRPEDSVAHSSSSDPRSSFEEIQEPQSCFPRQGALLYHNVGAAEVVAAENVPAGTSAWSQPMDPWSSSASSAGLSLCQPSRPSSWKGASESGSAWTSQPIGFWSSSALSAEPSLCSQSGPSSSRGASESMRIGRSTWYVSSSGVEDVNDVEHEKQQVSDGCSEAKSQDSKSPKKHGGGLLCKERWSTLTKFSPFKRRSVERDTMCSSKSDLVHHVTKKPPLSERSASARKAKSNPPSGVTSPTHEGAPGGLKPLTSDERKELRPFLPPELRKKLDSHSFLPGEEQHLYLTHTLSGKRELSRSLCEGEQSQLLRLTKAQLPDNSSSKKVDRDSGFCSMGSPAVLHKGSVSSELKHPQQVKHMSEALGK